MKKLLFFFLLFTSVVASAQIEKGTKIVGVGISNLSYHIDADLFSMSLHPTMMKFVNNRLAIGGNATIGITFPDGPTYVVGLTPMLRLYDKRTGNDRFFAQLGAGVTSIIYGDPEFYFSYGGGIEYNRFITQDIALELGLAYEGITSQNIDGYNSISLGLGLQVFLPPGTRLFGKRK